MAAAVPAAVHRRNWRYLAERLAVVGAVIIRDERERYIFSGTSHSEGHPAAPAFFRPRLSILYSLRASAHPQFAYGSVITTPSIRALVRR